MYGLVLMAAMATGTDTPSFGAPAPVAYGSCTGTIVAGCTGAGCTGVVYSSCSGFSSCSGYVSGCTGFVSGCRGSCSGRGGLLPLFPGLRSRMAGAFLGCRGSCFGSCTGVTACHGSACYGSSCFGSACYGSSCFGSACHGTACYGSSCFGTATYYGTDFSGGCVGRTAGSVIVGSAPVVQTGFAQSPQHIVVGVPALEFEAARAVPNAAPARLTVELPEDAQLYVDGNLTKGTGITRNFHTPDLSNGSTYYYDLKAVVVVEGKTISEEKRVLVRSGEAVNDSFGKLIAAVKASKDALAAAK